MSRAVIGVQELYTGVGVRAGFQDE